MLKSLPASFFIWLTVFGLKICIFSVLNFLNLFRSAVLVLLTLKEFSRLHCCLFVKDHLVISNLRRRRDLNPRAAINDLHPFQGCPFSLLGTSP